MLFKLIRNIIAGMLVFSMCVGFTGCFKKAGVEDEDVTQVEGVNQELYGQVQEIQSNVLQLNSGKLDISSQADSTRNTEVVKADFVFDVGEDGKLSYIQYQYDKKGKIIACEYSDGVTVQQWLIGNGWCTMNANPYTQENTHRYLQLLSTTPDINTVEGVFLEQKNNTDLYTLTLNVEELNNTTYKDSATEVENEMIEINTNKDGEMVSYLSTAKLKNIETNSDNLYTLEIVLSSYDEEIEKPDLKEYS